jgi:hypothetical protein
MPPVRSMVRRRGGRRFLASTSGFGLSAPSRIAHDAQPSGRVLQPLHAVGILWRLHLPNWLCVGLRQSWHRRRARSHACGRRVTIRRDVREQHERRKGRRNRAISRSLHVESQGSFPYTGFSTTTDGSEKGPNFEFIPPLARIPRRRVRCFHSQMWKWKTRHWRSARLIERQMGAQGCLSNRKIDPLAFSLFGL